jgi:hypothetical protein
MPVQTKQPRDLVTGDNTRAVICFASVPGKLKNPAHSEETKIWTIRIEC